MARDPQGPAVHRSRIAAAGDADHFGRGSAGRPASPPRARASARRPVASARRPVAGRRCRRATAVTRLAPGPSGDVRITTHAHAIYPPDIGLRAAIVEAGFNSDIGGDVPDWDSTESRESDEDAAWRDLVARFDAPATTTEPAPWPEREDVPPTPTRESRGANPVGEADGNQDATGARDEQRADGARGAEDASGAGWPEGNHEPDAAGGLPGADGTDGTDGAGGAGSRRGPEGRADGAGDPVGRGAGDPLGRGTGDPLERG